MNQDQQLVRALLQQHAAQFGLTLDERQLEQFAHYYQLLADWNQRVNLTRIVAPSEVAVRHFLDSLSCIAATGNLSERRLIDVGTGAGFPGIPLKIVYPQLELTLLESVGKKTQFLQAVVDALELTQVSVVNERAETVGQLPQHRERYDVAVARAVARLATLAEYLLPLVIPGGRAIAQKGESAQAEVAEATDAIQQLGGGQPTISDVMLPNYGARHQIVVIPKVSTTPPNYPRRSGMPLKRPL